MCVRTILLSGAAGALRRAYLGGLWEGPGRVWEGFWEGFGKPFGSFLALVSRFDGNVERMQQGSVAQ